MSRPVHASARAAAIADVGRAIAMAAGGVAVFAPAEWVLTLWSYSGTVGIASKLRLVALVATLSLWLWLILTLCLTGTLLAARFVRMHLDSGAGRAPGWFVPTPLHHGIRRGVPSLWATVFVAGIGGLAVQRGALWAMKTFKEPQLTAALIAALALVVVVMMLALRRVVLVAVTVAAEALAPLLGRLNTLGRWRAAGLALAALVGGAMLACWVALPQSRSVLPVRLVISALAVGLGMGLGALYVPRLPRPHRLAPWVGAGAFALVTSTLVWFGADLETRYIAITASPSLDRLIGTVRMANDLDRDGFGSVLGENDCAPFDKKLNPGAIDKPDDGIDQDCDGRDLTWTMLVPPPGPTKPVPPEFKRDWNFLLITIDTVRYDRTTFGGYAKKANRNTTPRLAELVDRSTSFSWAQAPSAGTMASIPAILTSKFFHSGIALKDRPGGIPPKLLPENTTLPEIMKRKGYYTGAIGTHEWWSDWGFEQGVDDYDNTLGKAHDPFDATAGKVTDRILAWVSRNQNKKWFMWAHYLDPHGRYVAHPDVVDYGSSEPDLYDAEIQWTDQQIGRLLDELKRLPSTRNTIIVITSDHGDSMGEHTVPVGTHGIALYRELLHVPLIVHVPDNRPRVVGGAVSPLDVVPTIAELAGIDVSDLSFEGRSLVPQIFYGLEDPKRIVFAETNAPARQRAAISQDYKLIYYLKSNLYELFDLKADPWEKNNLAPQNPPALAEMKNVLQLWLTRVMNARDPLYNQAYRQIADLVLPAAPTPSVKTDGQTLAGGNIEVLGIDPVNGPLVPGKPADVYVYFHAKQATTTPYKFALAAWPLGASLTEASPASLTRTGARLTGDGALATDAWKPGDYIREKFTLQVPAGWTSAQAVIGLITAETGGMQQRATGATPANDPTLAILGTLPLAPAAP
ncbi:MAG: sulfatase-like hydrolase/transferase [Kofleriaceae bacterium]|nr:sulfatase-like hydrolase/transferase [Kofleriaceae bacterium]